MAYETFSNINSGNYTVHDLASDEAEVRLSSNGLATINAEKKEERKWLKK
jgi:hypothetical protein